MPLPAIALTRKIFFQLQRYRPTHVHGSGNNHSNVFELEVKSALLFVTVRLNKLINLFALLELRRFINRMIFVTIAYDQFAKFILFNQNMNTEFFNETLL